MGINKISSTEERFWQLCEGLMIKTRKVKYKNSIFLFKNNVFYFEYNSEKKYLWCSYEQIWSVFEKEYKMEYLAIQYFIKSQLQEYLKCNMVSPLFDLPFFYDIKNNLKYNENDSKSIFHNGANAIEAHFKD